VKGFIEGCRRVLRSLISETVVFVAGVEMAEAHPETAVSLARTCMELVNEAMRQISSPEGRDEHLEKAYGELGIARELFKSVIVGEPVSPIAKRAIPQGAEGRRILILDIAHSHTHRAIDSLRKSKNFESYQELLHILGKARRESAPTTLYRLAYETAGS